MAKGTLPVIEVRNLSKFYGSIHAVDSVSFSVKGDKSSKLRFAFRYVSNLALVFRLEIEPMTSFSESTILIMTATSATASSFKCSR